MSITAARELKDHMACFVGIGLPSEAANLARLIHAPEIVLIYESGTIQARPNVLPLSIGDGELCDSALTTVDVPEMFRYWLQGGHVDMGFLGTAQIDKYANLNTTVIAKNRAMVGDEEFAIQAYDDPKVRLPGGGGAPEIATAAKQTLIMVKQSTRTFVEQVDFITSLGFGRDGQGRKNNPHMGQGPGKVITDLCVMKPDPDTRELTVVSLHPGISCQQVEEATGWPVAFVDELTETSLPTVEELDILRELKQRSAVKPLGHKGGAE